MNKNNMQEILRQSLAAEITFPQVIGKLLAEGVESYHIDFVRLEGKYYAANGDTHVITLAHAPLKPALEFSAKKLETAIRASQAGKIDYNEFIAQAVAAGISYYIVYLTGRKVIYFGREGDFHIEPFPQKP